MFNPNFGEDEPILTIIFFGWVGEKPPTIHGIIVAFLFEAFWGLTLEDSGSDIGDEEVLQLQSARMKMDGCLEMNQMEICLDDRYLNNILM